MVLEEGYGGKEAVLRIDEFDFSKGNVAIRIGRE